MTTCEECGTTLRLSDGEPYCPHCVAEDSPLRDDTDYVNARLYGSGLATGTYILRGRL